MILANNFHIFTLLYNELKMKKCHHCSKNMNFDDFNMFATCFFFTRHRYDIIIFTYLLYVCMCA